MCQQLHRLTFYQVIIIFKLTQKYFEVEQKSYNKKKTEHKHLTGE